MGLWLYFVFRSNVGGIYSGASSCKAEKKSSVDFGTAFFGFGSAGAAVTWILPSSFPQHGTQLFLCGSLVTGLEDAGSQIGAALPGRLSLQQLPGTALGRGRAGLGRKTNCGRFTRLRVIAPKARPQRARSPGR